MNTQNITTLACVTTLLGVFIVGFSLPLAYRKVPMNGIYGVRIPAAFRSEQNWYDINAYGGRLLAKWSVVVIICGIVGFVLPRSMFPVYYWVNFGVVLFCVLAPLIQVIVWAGRLPKV
jgi:hypothetical protein